MALEVTVLARPERELTSKEKKELRRRLVTSFVEQLGEALVEGVARVEFHRLWKEAATIGNHPEGFQQEIIAEGEAEYIRRLRG